MNLLASALVLFAVSFPSGDPVPGCDDASLEKTASDGQAAVVERKTNATSARIRAKRMDFDRDEGVVMFDEDVFVEYSTDYTMNAAQLYAIFKGTNELSRIVASGGIVITNETRVGSCEMAVFRNLERRIEMYGLEGAPAKLTERSGTRGTVAGEKITYWIDTERVEVVSPVITVEERDVR